MVKAAIALAAVVVSVMGQRAPEGPVAADPTATDAGAPTCTPAASCCAVCDAGKACGNSCISRRKTCHKGRGCACNAAEVCGS